MTKKWLIPSDDPEKIRPVFNKDRLMRVAILLSGGGSTADHLCGYVQEQTPEKLGFEIVLLYADRKKDCGVLEIGEKYDINAVATPKSFLRVSDPDRMLNGLLAYTLIGYDVDVVASMGAGWAIDEQVYDNWLCLNNHPGDLRVVGPDGKKAYAGWHEEPIMKAMVDGQKNLYVTVNEMDKEQDEGLPWMISDPVAVTETPEVIEALSRYQYSFRKRAGEYQDMLKEVGDKKIMARTLELLAKGRFGFDVHGSLCFDCLGLLRSGVEYKKTFKR